MVSGPRRGSLMSLTVALGQVGFAVGGVIAGPLFARVGYGSNTVAGAAAVLGMGLIVWFMIPEPEGDYVDANEAKPKDQGPPAVPTVPAPESRPSPAA